MSDHSFLLAEGAHNAALRFSPANVDSFVLALILFSISQQALQTRLTENVQARHDPGTLVLFPA